MPTIRIQKTKDYTVMSNTHLRDRRLSLKAVGLLSVMLSLPEDWDYTENGLTIICKDGRSSVRSALAELEENGYMQRRRIRDEKGQLKAAEYIIFESPQPLLSAEKPMLENPILDNRTERNKDISNYRLNIPPIVPQKSAGKLPAHNPDRFAGFWAMYPRHEKRAAAVKAWDKLALSDAEIDDLARGLAWFLAGEMWQKGIGIPYASTWLNQRRWEERHDDPPPGDGTVQESEGAYRL